MTNLSLAGGSNRPLTLSISMQDRVMSHGDGFAD